MGAVSDDVEKRLVSGQPKLQPTDWKSGEKIWAVEVIAPFGGAEEMVNDLKTKVFPDRRGALRRCHERREERSEGGVMNATIEGVGDRFEIVETQSERPYALHDYHRLCSAGSGCIFHSRPVGYLWRPFFLLPALTSELIAARPEPLLTLEPRGKKTPDIFNCMDTWLVRENVKNAIEELEPSVHSFVPLSAVTEKSKKNLGVYYAMRIQQVLDAVVVEGSDYQEGPGRLGLEKSKSKRVITLELPR